MRVYLKVNFLAERSSEGSDGVDRRQRTTQRILDGATRVFAEGGYAATSMEDVAAAAGVSKLLLYRDFAGKRELYLAVLERVTGRLASVDLATGQHAVRGLLAAARADPAGFALLVRHAAREPEFSAYAARLFAVARAAVEGRYVRPCDPDPRVGAWAADVATRLAVEGVLGWLRLGDPGDDEEFLGRLTRSLRALVRPAASDPENRPGREAGPEGGTS
jgi:AcrR family transcriptional regulator